jgi:O-antigen/teichoic acid export membrane protein
MTELATRGPSAPWNRLFGRLATDHRGSLIGVGWAGAAQMANMAIRLASNLILTRLLAPDVYGLFGAAMAVLTMLDWLADLGVQPALIRHPDGPRPEFLNTGWWINLGRGLVVTTIAAGLAYPVAVINHQMALAPVLLALALRPALLGLRSPAMPMLRRRLDFRAIFVDEVGQTVVSTAVSVLTALVWRSLWAIVLGTLAGTVTAILISYALCPVRPRWRWDRHAASELAHLGRQIFLNTMVMALWLNLDRLLGLRFLGEVRMGYYVVALNLTTMVEVLLARGCDVYFATLARCEDLDARNRWHRKACRRLSCWGMPAMALGVAAAPTVIGVLYDRRYAGAKVVCAILSARLMVRILGQVQFQYLLSMAEVRINTRSYVVALVAQAALLVPLVKSFGVVGLAVDGLISTTLLTGVQSFFLWRRGFGGASGFPITLAWMALGLLTLVLR